MKDLTIRTSGRVQYDEEKKPSWEMLSSAKVWTEEDYAGLRSSLRAVRYAFTTTESAEAETFSMTPSQEQSNGR